MRRLLAALAASLSLAACGTDDTTPTYLGAVDGGADARVERPDVGAPGFATPLPAAARDDAGDAGDD